MLGKELCEDFRTAGSNRVSYTRKFLPGSRQHSTPKPPSKPGLRELGFLTAHSMDRQTDIWREDGQKQSRGGVSAWGPGAVRKSSRDEHWGQTNPPALGTVVCVIFFFPFCLF